MTTADINELALSGEKRVKIYQNIKVLKYDWFLAYDKASNAMTLKNSKKMSEKERLNLKSLEYADFRKFDVKQKKVIKAMKEGLPLEETGTSMMCINCDKWLSGLCVKHPLVFVHEKVPQEEHYLVTETFPKLLLLENSTIPLAGKGVFTRLPLPAGLAFGPYSGLLENTISAEKSGYSWNVKRGDGIAWVDARKMYYSNWMRYVNCPRFEKEQNLMAVQYKENIFYYTYRPVKAGEELMVWYGREYGVYLRIPHSEKTTCLAPKNKSLCKAVEKTKKLLIKSSKRSDLSAVEEE